MRIAFGGIMHESNTFSNVLMTLQRFEESGLKLGRDIVNHWQDTNSEFGGVIDAGRRMGLELVPTVATWGMPAGPVEDDTFEQLLDRLLSGISEIPDLDGVVLSQHGAMATESRQDADAEVLRRVRQVVGSVPIVLTLDFHANISKPLVESVDALITYDTYPHVDFAQRGHEAVQILHSILKGELTPVTVLKKPPIIPNIMRQSTHTHPMATLLSAAFEAERLPEVVNVSLAAGFPYADVRDIGMSIVVITNGQEELAQSIACRLEELTLSFVEDFDIRLVGPQEAVRQAVTADAGPVILADVGDNVGGGSPGDGTVLLRELIEAGAEGALVLIADPEAVQECVHAGVRSEVNLEVGGKSDGWHGPPVPIRGKVRLISDGVFVNVGPMRDGVREDQGCSAVIESDGIILVLTEHKMPMWNLQQLRSLGIEPARLKVIVNKSAIAFRAAYEPIAGQILEVDTPGLTAADISIFPYRNIRRPIFPLDRDVNFQRRTK